MQPKNGLPGSLKHEDYSVQIDNRETINAFISNPENTFLVSFPRTGSHWLRMIMELYFERPSLVRIFYFFDNKNYLTLHTHDLDLELRRNSVIYLYRDPVDTIFSQLNYHNLLSAGREQLIYWSDLYGKHLAKWLYCEQFTKNKTILTYEGLRKNIIAEFSKITSHFYQPLDDARLMNAAALITKDEVKRKTLHDAQVVKLEKTYPLLREDFREKNGQLIWETILKNREELTAFFQ